MGKDNNANIITEDVVRRVAELARLSLDEENISMFRHQLSDILKYITQLNEVDTEGVSPTTHVVPSMKDVFREDVVKPSLSPEEALRNAPQRHDNFFKVPKII